MKTLKIIGAVLLVILMFIIMLLLIIYESLELFFARIISKRKYIRVKYKQELFWKGL